MSNETPRSLTPYDTGEVLEPHPWTTFATAATFGRVDFENDESATMVTLRVVRDTDGYGYMIEALSHTGAPLTLKTPGVEQDPDSECRECGERPDPEDTDPFARELSPRGLCASCEHDAERSGDER